MRPGVTSAFPKHLHAVGQPQPLADDAEFRDRSFIEMGISVGWADVYPWFIADQYIDISGMPDGDYALVVRQDVDKRVLEKSTENNTAIGCVHITGDVAQEISCRARGVRMDR